MHRRIAGLAGSLLALLAGCGPAGGSGRASIVSASPGQIDLLGDDASFGVARIQVVLSGETSQVVCGSSSGADFPSAIAERVDASNWGVTFYAAPALSVGAHVGELEVFLSSDPGCSLRDGESRRIPYRLTKVDALAWPDAVQFGATSETTAAELTASVRIDMASGPQHAWTARSTSPWVVLDTAAGLTGDSLVLHVAPSAAGSNLVNADHNSGRIEITGDTAGMSSRYVNVGLFLRLAEARAAMPADQPAGPARRFRVHGIGFTAEAMAGARLSVEGVPGAVFTRLGDSDLAVELPAALPAGSYRVTATNALGVPVGTAALRLTAPVATTRAVLAGDGAGGGRMLWDGARNALLVLEPPPDGFACSFTLRRHLLQEGAWSTTTAHVDALRRMSISPDGTRLLATSALNFGVGLHALDLERLVVRGYGAAVDQYPEQPSAAPLAVTVDERAWFGTNNALVAYDLRNHSRPGIVVPTTWARNDRSLRTIASRDGGRLLVSRPGVDAFAYLDVVEGVFHSNPAGATTFDAISDTGDRVLCGGMVYDASFALLGTLPDQAILSGDGRRAFRLESRSDWTVGGLAPIVHVYDLTAPAAGGGALHELGTVDLLDHATCAALEATCAPTSSLAVTPDGRVLFAQTAGGVVVVPIPEALAGP